MPETGVHVADLGVHDAPIWVFTMPRSRCSRSRDFRNDLTDCFLLPSIEMQLRIAEKARPNVPNLETAIPLIAKQPTIRVVWGPYARPDPLDEQNIVTTVRLALGKPGEVPFITRRMAFQKVADVFNIENADAIVEELDAQQAEQEAKDQAAAEQEAKLAVPPTPKKPPQ